jgi:class 3 adenylate cyclase
MVAASTVAHLDDEFWLEPVGTLQLKGKSQGVEVFALMGTKEARAQDRPAASIGARSAAG